MDKPLMPKEEFPIFRNNPGLVFLDSAASAQKPKEVIDAMSDFYSSSYANIHRGMYKLSERATNAYENARKTVASFIGAKPEQIMFTKNATEALNLAAYVLEPESYAVSVMEHHSNFVPWQAIAGYRKKKIHYVDIDDEGFFRPLPKAGLYALSAASNVLGTLNGVKALCREIRDSNAISVIDATQAVPHAKFNVNDAGCDFAAFSGHKMLGPTGIGVLYAREGVLENAKPFLFGGDMIRSVAVEGTEFSDVPYRYEAGTPPIAETVGLAKAIGVLEGIGMDNVRKHEMGLTKYMLERISEMGKITQYGPKDASKKAGVVAFNVGGMHANDVAYFLSAKNIAIRGGHHCAMPLHKRLGITGSARASFYVYNDRGDVDALIEALGAIGFR
jgi:cysteine desulfurase/selenocysteine lyase